MEDCNCDKKEKIITKPKYTTPAYLFGTFDGCLISFVILIFLMILGGVIIEGI